jgi:hypothetical protein
MKTLLYFILVLFCGSVQATAELITNVPVKVFEKAVANNQTIAVIHEVVKPKHIPAQQTNYLASGLIEIRGIIGSTHAYKFVLLTNSADPGVELWRKEIPTMGELQNPIKILDVFKNKEAFAVVYLVFNTSDAVSAFTEYRVHCSVVEPNSAGDAKSSDAVLLNVSGASERGRIVKAANIFRNNTDGVLCVNVEGSNGDSETFIATGKAELNSTRQP